MVAAFTRGEHARARVALAAPALVSAVAVLGGCDRGAGTEPDGRERTVEASEFACDGGRCVQRHVRLPDDGEWRCAEQAGVAWCAGGEPAAGVVRAPAERGFSCGTRRVTVEGRSERVCVDEAPDTPSGERQRYRCRFLEERGVQRECIRENVAPRPVTSRGAPDCWLDADCAPARCDRGRCTRGPG